MENITRKSMLGRTGVEYGDYTMNHALGCSHGCKYPCYAFLMKKRFGQVKTYEEWTQPKIVANTLELLDEEIPRLKHKIKSVHLCFSTDPFMYGNAEIHALSLAAIRKLNEAGIKCTVLTKGILPIDFALNFLPENEYGISLVSLDENFRARFEPNTAPYVARLAALQALHNNGCFTWVSIEPYPTPNLVEQNLADILNVVSFVDKIVFGRMNYNREATAYSHDSNFYTECAAQVIDFCEAHNIHYHIKRGTIRGDSHGTHD